MSETLTETAKEAASTITEELLGVAAADEEARPEERAAAAEALETMREDAPAEPEPGEEPELEAAAPVEIAPLAPEDWTSVEPDYEAEARAELDTSFDEQAPETQEDFGFDVDPQLQEERVRRVAAEKKLAHIEELRVKDARKAWKTEALEHAPYASLILGDELEKIDASSKRAFLKQAADAHNVVVRALEKTHGPAGEKIAAEVAAARDEAKAEAQAAYGMPTAGPGAAPTNAAEQKAKIDAAREKRGLFGAIRARIDFDSI